MSIHAICYFTELNVTILPEMTINTKIEFSYEYCPNLNRI